METKTTEFIIPKESSWQFERKLKPDDKKVGKYVLIQPGAQDVMKVLQAYTHHPVSAYNIASIEIVYNENLNRQFFSHMKIMDERKKNAKYVPTWRNTTTGGEKAWREATYYKLQALSASHTDPNLSNVMLLPLWHGTSDTVSDYIFGGGYGIFSSNDPNIVTDEGFFGKGVYTAHEAEYAFRSYAQKHGDKAVLLLNWVSIYEAYPVIDGDMSKLKGKMGGFDQCDAHFIPVRSDLHPDTDTYYPCAPGQDADYHEIVVFMYQQCLPRYRVRLIQNAPQPPLNDMASLHYQSALDSLSLDQYEQVASAFEDAVQANHPGAAVRLHWWYSGASGVYPRNSQALTNVQAVQTASVNELKQKANFRSDNDPESQFTLAWCYQHGLGCEINLVKAAQYYWIAAVQGHRDAQYQLGVCCASGIGVKADMKQAIVYYEQAAAQGHVHAHYVLSHCYEFGLGIQANPTKALEHKQAAQKGKHPLLAGLPTVNPVNISSHVQLEQEIKQLKQQLLQHLSTLKERESQLAQQELQLNQQREEAAQNQRKIQEKDEIIIEKEQELDQKGETLKEKSSEINELKFNIAQLGQEDQKLKEQLTQQTATLEEKESQLTLQELQFKQQQQELREKDERIDKQKQQMEQLKDDLTESKAREAGLKRGFEAYKNMVQLLSANHQTSQPNLLSTFFLSNTTSKPTLDIQIQQQNQLVADCLKWNLASVKYWESKGVSFSYPNQEGLYPLVAAVYACSLETVRYIESKLKNKAEEQWSQVDSNKAKAQLDRWTPTELPENATYGDLGDWYTKYEGASWCAYYDTECLKQDGYENWSGAARQYEGVVETIGGNELWGGRSARVEWTNREKNKDVRLSDEGVKANFYEIEWGSKRWMFYRRDTNYDFSAERAKANLYKTVYRKTSISRSTAAVFNIFIARLKTHDDVVKTIREQMNELRSEVESKAKQSSAAAFNPNV